MTYKIELGKAMAMIAQDPRALFIGQSVKFGGQAMFSTLTDVAEHRRLEMPVAEEMQLGLCTGLAMQGYLPVCIYPRIDFMLLCMNQLVNHLDKQYVNNKVIIRTSVGANTDKWNAGVQHTQDHVIAFQQMLQHIPVVPLRYAGEIMPKYEWAMDQKGPVIMVEYVKEY